MEEGKRKNKELLVEALTNAQKLIFAPMAFCAISSAIDFGIFDLLAKEPRKKEDIMSSLNLDDYTVETLLQVMIINNLARFADNKYALTKTGEMFLYNDMTKANFNFIKDVCYIGANELTSSFKERKPKGLYKITKKYETIYPALVSLPDKMQKSWYEFDHLYSDNCFEEVFSIINKKYSSIFDIGGNTGKFEALCIKNDSDVKITMLDLKENIEKIKNDNKFKNCNFIPINVLDKEPNYPKISNSAVLLSQFLDCFSKEDIVKILSDIAKQIDSNSSIFILEPYTDRQKFYGAEYALIHTSLYFTCMANGVSKFYTLSEMEDLIEKSGLKVSNRYDGIGLHDYTLLEVKKNEMVSD